MFCNSFYLNTPPLLINKQISISNGNFSGNGRKVWMTNYLWFLDQIYFWCGPVKICIMAWWWLASFSKGYIFSWNIWRWYWSSFRGAQGVLIFFIKFLKAQYLVLSDFPLLDELFLQNGWISNLNCNESCDLWKINKLHKENI